jgi:methionyl-tRNA synthetase
MYIITTPIPYTNGKPHLGHLLEGIFADTIARFQRRLNDGNVILTMGLDQHGLKIYQAAEKEGTEPELYVEKTGQTFVELWKQYDVNYDSWTPTHSKHHEIVVHIFWKLLNSKGYIQKQEYKGLYNVYDEAFIKPQELEEDGSLPGRPGIKPIEMEETNYFFLLSKLQNRVKEHLERVDVFPAEAKNEMLAFIAEGLEDISVTREKSKLTWGIPVPEDEEQVIYVWFDALINYATAVVNFETLDRWVESPLLREEIEVEILNEIKEAFPIDLVYVGKDIAKFHLIVWPAMLAAMEIELPLKYIRHGMINAGDGRKMSKSLGNGVDPEVLHELFGKDGTRFIMLHEVNIAGDTSFDLNAIKEVYNSHLANNIGNLLMRVTTLISVNFDGYVETEDTISWLNKSAFYELMSANKVREAIDVVLEACRKGNEYLEKTEPWKLVKQDKKEEAAKILSVLLVLLRDSSELLSIIIPETADKIREITTAEIITKAPVLFGKVE